MTNRERVIRQLLERWHELTEPNGRTGLAGGDGVMQMPRHYTDTVREIERLLRVMRDDRHRPLTRLPNGDKVSVRAMWWHLSEQYIRSTTVVRYQPVSRKLKRKRTLTTIEPRTVTVTAAKVDQARVDAGIGWLAANWQLQHEPMLPQELLVTAA